MTLAKLPLGLALTLSAAALLACDSKDGSVSGTATVGSETVGSETGDDTGGTGSEPSDSDGPNTSGGSSGEQCEQTETVIGLDEQSAAGLTPQQLLDDTVGLYAGSMQWLQEGPVQYSGAPGPTGVEIEVTYDGGEARSVEGDLLVPCDHEGPCPCPDSLEVDVGLRFTSEDGVFDEQFDAVVVLSIDDTGFSSGRSELRLRFQPDETSGTFSTASLDLADEFALNYLELGLTPSGGGVAGSLNAEVEGMGLAGFGTIASIGAVVDLEGCTGFYDAGSACGLAGCIEVQGTPVNGSPGADSCSCSQPKPYCFGAPLAGDDALTLYTRPFNDGFESFDEVVEFPVSTDLGGEWRSCSEAPEVDQCSCEVTCG